MARVTGSLTQNLSAVRLTLAGHVQGVGFRPFVFRLANQYGLAGSVQNRFGEVRIEVAGPAAAVQQFQADLIDKAPPLSQPSISYSEAIHAPEWTDFQIVASSASSDALVFVPQDYFMCDDCRRELLDPDDRRYQYPFINCTQCGPRYTLIESLPYDRPNTSMAGFPLCADCEREYLDPSDRRFHAEPVACDRCGPRLEFVAADRSSVETKDAALDAAVAAIRAARVVAVKGIGGYHLVCDATDTEAVGRLRQRKRRPDKPFAVMLPVTGQDGLDAARHHVSLTGAEAELLNSPIRPIVLATRNESDALADNIAPGLNEIGVFLPYSPLHQLLLEKMGGPVVATSGNISGEPVLTDKQEAATRLEPIADSFLHHDRPIVRPADDPVYRRISNGMRPLRLGRGCAPLEIDLPWPLKRPLLAVGGHMKGTVALAWDRRAVVSPHIGEMDSPRSLAVFEQLVSDLQALYGVAAECIVCDAHPGYTTRQWAHRQRHLHVEEVWHHRAHASAVAAEFALEGPWLMFTWDGVGLGEDSTLWGGEAMLGNAASWRRVASFRTFRLPGGERAGREPWRSAAALHWECGRSWPECPDTDGLAEAAWRRQMNAPETSAAGRLFDAAAALICGVPETSFEAQGPMLIESLCRRRAAATELPLRLDDDGVLRSDWQPLLDLLCDKKRDATERAEAFHSSMATAISQQAVAVRERHDVAQVGLCGGVFQNRVLTELASELLEQQGFQVWLPARLPCNDAALSFGQAAEIAAQTAGA